MEDKSPFFSLIKIQNWLDSMENHHRNAQDYDIAYFTAQPLMKSDGRSVAGEVDVVDWAEKMQQILFDNGKKCNYIHEYATLPNLSRICVSGTKLLSITFHGSKDKTRLCLEDHNEHRTGLPKDYSRNEIITALGDQPPELVVVVSKHAEPVANFFADCGIPNVVGMRYQYSVQDTAVETFQKNFYKWILGGADVTHAYEQALLATKKQEKVDGWPQEKFFLMGRGRHDNKIFEKLQTGQFKDKTTRDGNFLLPRPVNNFVGRYKSLYDLVSKVTKSEMTWVHGVEGWGKTALAVMAAHYLKERKCFKNILYVDFTSRSNHETPEKIIAECLQTPPEDPEDTYADYEVFSMIQQFGDSNGSFMKKDASQIRSPGALADAFSNINGDVLLILDHVCQRPTIKFSEMMKFCFQFVHKAHHVKILACGRIFQQDIANHYMKSNRDIQFNAIELKPLNMQASSRLLVLSLHKHILKKDFPDKSPRALSTIVNEHPCGHLARKYFVPLAVKRIAHRVNTVGMFMYLGSHHLEEIVKDLLPFHIYLHHQGGGRSDSEAYRRNELVKTGMNDKLQAGWALDVLHSARQRLQGFREKWASGFSTEMRPQHSYRQEHFHPSHSGPSYPHQNTQLPPTPGFDSFSTRTPPTSGFDSFSTRASEPNMRGTATSPSIMIGATTSSKRKYDVGDIGDDSSEEDVEPLLPSYSEGMNPTGVEKKLSYRNSEPDFVHFSQIQSQKKKQLQDLKDQPSSRSLHKLKSVPITTNPRKWTSEEFADWASSHGNAYTEYRDLLVENSIDGELISGEIIGIGDLEEIGLRGVHARILIKKFQIQLKKFETTE